MKLHEYESMDLFSRYGIPILPYYVIRKADEIKELKKPVVLKSQALVGGRGKAGGIKFAKTTQDAKKTAEELFSKTLKGTRTKEILIREEAEILHEFYLGCVIDREKRRVTMLASAEGGIDIEEVAEKNPEEVKRIDIDPFIGFYPYHGRKLGRKIGLAGEELQVFGQIAFALYKLSKDYDAELCEINPLARTPQGLLALDAKMNIDDNSIYRHEEYKAESDLSELEESAREKGIAYVDLSGEIGIIGCGAGLVMASIDVLNFYGGKPANFLDVGGGATAENMKIALELLGKKKGLKSIFINIFGGITRCDEIAKGIVEAHPGVPLSIRMMGTHEAEGKQILFNSGYQVLDTMEEAAKKAIELSGGGVK
jgi:succinyl-CoA synthetase beta subunit